VAAGKRCGAPESGGSGATLTRYILGYTLKNKAGTPEEKRLAYAQYGERLRQSMLREDFGVGTILKYDDIRPSAVLARNVTSLATAGLEIDAIFTAARGRMKSSACHDVISFSVEESKWITDETVLDVAKRVMDGMGYENCPAVYSVHRDQPNVHVHIATCRVDPTTMLAVENARDYSRFAFELRKAEMAVGLEAGHGDFVRDKGSDGAEFIRKATLAEKQSWKNSEQTHRLDSLVRSFVSDSGGLESYEDRRDRIASDLRKYLDGCYSRGEEPLRADIHRLAAIESARIEKSSRGGLVLRFQERAAEGAGRERENEHGEVETIPLKGESSDVVLPVDLDWIAPDPLAGLEGGTKYERERQAAAKHHRAWLSDLGSVERSEVELVEKIKADPGRVTRDVVASGEAVFDSSDLDRWIADRITDSDQIRALSDFVVKADKELVGLSLNAAHPLWTTRKQKALEEDVSARAARLAQSPDGRYEKAALDRMVAKAQEANGFAFSAEQMRVYGALDKRLVVVQGDAGSGKTDTLADVLRRYAEFTGRPIVGLTTASKAAEKLSAASGIESVNTALAAALEGAQGKEMVPKNSIVILDESSMVSMEAVSAVLRRAEQQDATVVVIGDEAQLANIAAGDTMRVLAAAAKSQGQYRTLTTVYRQTGKDVDWMRTAVPEGGAAIREADEIKTRAYFEEFIRRGHVTFHGTKREEVEAKAADIVEHIRQGKKTIATGYSRKDSLYGNRAVRDALGQTGKGRVFRTDDGNVELAVGDRVVFKRNAQKRLGVLNGYTGTVTELARQGGSWKVGVELDGGKTVFVDPKTYPHLAHGWVTTTHVSQGQGDPVAIPSIGRGDSARSAHVALTRCTEGLRVHTTLTGAELLDHLCSPQSLRAKSDVLLFAELEKGFGKDSTWAKAVRRAAATDADPLRQQHREWLRGQQEAFRQGAATLHAAYAERLKGIEQLAEPRGKGALRRDAQREMEQAVREMRAQSPVLSFVEWAAQHKTRVERSEEVGQRAGAVREAREKDASLAREQARVREQAQERAKVQKPEQKRGMRR
jgi:hypothetical protein